MCNGTAIIHAGADGLVGVDVAVTEIDNDEQSLRVTPLEIDVPEGGYGVFAVELAHRPCGPVVVRIANVDGAQTLQPTPGTAALMFPVAGWNLPQTVVCQAFADANVCNDWATLRVSSPGLPSVDVSANELDNDVQALLVEPRAIDVPENGGSTFEVALAYRPCEDVTVTLSVAGDADLSVYEAKVVFTPVTWAEPQPVAVTASDDADACAGEATIQVSVAGAAAVEVTATELDDDVQALVVDPPFSLEVPEGGSETFTVALALDPCEGVTVTITKVAGDVDVLLAPDPTVLLFTPGDWNVPQTATVTANEDDDACTGSAELRLRADGFDPALLWALEQETAIQEFVVGGSDIVVPEGGDNFFTVALAHRPCGNVKATVANVAGDPDVQPTPAVLLFSPWDYDVERTVTVSADHDIDVCDDPATMQVASGAIPPVEVLATEGDDDVQALRVAPQTISMREGRRSDFTVALDYQPCGDTVVVVERVAKCDPDIVVGPDFLLFTRDDWNVPQSVMVSAETDVDVCDDECTIRAKLSGGGDEVDVDVTVTDRDELELLVEPPELAVVEGADAELEVRLSHQPCADATVTVEKLDGGDEDLSIDGLPLDLVFTTENWYVPQVLLITAVEDADTVDGCATFRLTCPDCVDSPVDAVACETDLQMHEDFETGDLSKYPWEASGDADWLVECAKRRQSGCAARSGAIGNKEETVLELTREVLVKSKLTFDVKCSTHRKDKLYFAIDGGVRQTWSGRKKRKRAKFTIPAGVHTFTWTYQKNKKKAAGKDAVWIDDVRLEPAE